MYMYRCTNVCLFLHMLSVARISLDDHTMIAFRDGNWAARTLYFYYKNLLYLLFSFKCMYRLIISHPKLQNLKLFENKCDTTSGKFHTWLHVLVKTQICYNCCINYLEPMYVMCIWNINEFFLDMGFISNMSHYVYADIPKSESLAAKHFR
jgi:hypothetical protein